MRKIKLFLSMLMLIAFSVGNVWAADVTTTWTATSGAFGSEIGSGTFNTTVSGSSDTQEWSYARTLSSGVSYTGWTSNCIQLGKNGGVENLTLSTSNIPGTIKSVAVECASYQGKHNVSITVGETEYLASTATSSWTTVGAKSGTGTSSGTITISFTGGTRALYIKSITVVYNEGGAPDPVLQSIVISGAPDKDTYEAGEEFDPTGLVATGHYDNSTSADITSSVEWAYTPAGALTQGLTSVNVTATKGTVVGNKDVNITVNAALPKSSLIFTAACGGSGTANDGVEWTVESDAAESNFDSNRGVHYGTNSKAVEYIELTSAAFSDNITKIEVEAAGANTPSISITVGGETFGETATGITNSNVKYTFEPTLAQSGTEFTGVIVVRLAKESSANGALYVKSVVVTYESDGKEAADLAYDDEDLSNLVKLGGAFTAPTLTNPHSLTVAYESSNTDVAEVASNGALTIKAVGVAEITASFAGDEDYKAGSASYTIFVATEAGTAEDPLSEASAKALIDNGCTLNAHVGGTVVTPTYYSSSHTYTVTLTDGFQFYKLKDLGNELFTSDYLKAGDQLVVLGPLGKHNTTYQLGDGCYLTSYTEYTAPKTHIISDIDNPITVAAAIGYIDDPVTYDLTDDVWVRGVVTYIGQTSGQSPIPYIDVKDADAENSFRFFNYTINGSISEEIQLYDILIAVGKLDKHNTTYELNGCEVVDLNRPAVDVESVNLVESTALVGVGETLTLHASVLPENASNKGITWSVQSGNDKAEVDANGVVTGIAAGQAVVRAASAENASIFAECTVTVDPTLHKVTFDATVDKGESPLSKSNITFSCSNGVLNNESEYRLYKNSTTTLACSVGNITKIEFIGVSGKPASGFEAPSEGSFVTDGNNGTWTGNAASVSFVASNEQVRATEIIVTYKEDTRAEAGLAYAETAIAKTIGDDAFVNTLTNPNSVAVTYESSNTDVAEVANDGTVTIKTQGTATISASFAGDATYKPASVSYELTVNEPGLDNVTFDATSDVAGSGELSITKNGFTLTFTGGAMDNSSEYRLYKDQTMTLSSNDYLIKKIEFTCTTDNPISGFADATGLDKANNQWTGEANKVELTASNKQVRIEQMIVYYVEDTRAASGLAWSTDEVEITLGDPFTAASLVNPNNIDAAEISIESNNEDLATVTAGVVELVADATGTATITATFAGNATYKPAEFSYTIMVNDPTPVIYVDKLNVNFGTVAKDASVEDKTITVTLQNVAAATAVLGGTNADAFSIDDTEIADGDVITISVASTATLGSYSATITITDNAGLAPQKVVNLSLSVEAVETPVSTESKWVAATEIADGVQVLIVGEDNGTFYAMSEDRGNNRGVVAGTIEEDVFTPGAQTMSFTLVSQEGGTYALRASNGKYLYAGGTGNSNWLNTKAYDGELDANAKWNIDLANSTIIATSSNRNEMRFNKTNNPKIISCYQSTSTSPTVALYVPKAIEPEWVDIRPGATSGKYYTVCLPKKVVDFRGGNFWSMSKRGDGIAYLEEATGTLPAGTPYIFEVTGAKLEVVYEGDATDVAGTNGALHGTFVAMDQDALSAKATDLGSDIYLLSNNQLWNVTTGGASGNSLAAGRAYIVYDELVNAAPAPGRRVRAIPMGQQTATGIDALNTSETPVKTIINGELFIIRGEKMYDATGRLVK